MTDKEIVISGVLAAAGSLILTGVIALVFWIGWYLTFVIGIIVLMPLAKRAVRFYVDNECDSLEDFLIELDEYLQHKKKQKNDSDKDNRIM